MMSFTYMLARTVEGSASVAALQIGVRAESIAFMPGFGYSVAAANALGALVGCIYTPTMMTAVYNNAKRSPCVLRYHIAAEGGWDVGLTAGLSVAAAITALGIDIGWAVATAALGAAIVFVLLHRYYTRHNAETIDAALTQAEEAKI